MSPGRLKRRRQASADRPPEQDWQRATVDQLPDGPDRAGRPIIVTLQFDMVTQDFFEALRRRYFPPSLNRVPAHLTLFHNLPGSLEPTILSEVAAVSARPAFRVAVTGLKRLGRGVAFSLESAELTLVRRTLAERFKDHLIAQDRERFRPHVTIQNKVSPQEARATESHIASTFAPFDVQAEGLQLWRYAGGPWIPLAAVAFTERG